MEISIVMPCLNEADTVGICVSKAIEFLKKSNINGEVIVADNGSTDGSVEIAKSEGARVVHVTEKGYGNALMGGIAASKGKYIIMGDSDDSYDFSDLMPFVRELRKGYDLVMGNRFAGEIKQGAMPWHHKFIGNPILSGLGKIFFKTNIGDFHCGLRGFSRRAYNVMQPQTTGMEFASELVIKSSLYGLTTSEVPIILWPDGRKGRSHLRSFRDGLRHLKFIFAFSPRWLFFYPGIILMLFGMIMSLLIFFFPDFSWDIHTMLYSSSSIIIGFQSVVFAVFSKTFVVHENLLPSNPQIENILKKLTPNKGILLSLIMLLIGISSFVYTFFIWKSGDFWELGTRFTMRYVIFSSLLSVLGFQLLFSSMFFYLLKLNTKK